MRAVFAAPEQDDGQFVVEELHGWFVGDGELHRGAEIRRVPVGSVGEMGALDVVEVVVGQGIAALNLALAYATWRSTRPAAPRVTVTLPNGVTVTDDGPEALERILAALREHGDGGGTPAAGASTRTEDPDDGAA